MSDAAPPTLSCRECHAVGVPVAVNATVRGAALPAVSRLPSCGCYLRKGKAPANVVSLLSGAPALDEVVRSMDGCAPLPVAPSVSVPPPSSGSTCTHPAVRSGQVRPTCDAEKLRESRELMVYHLECTDEALLGTVELLAEHKLEDVLQMLRDELEVDAAAVSRGTMGSGPGSSLKVPIHRNQYRKSALQFFPSSTHCLLVTEFNDDGSDEGSEG
jgi:hypothetical protein